LQGLLFGAILYATYEFTNLSINTLHCDQLSSAASISLNLQGLLFGAVLYATYEFTNLSVISSWTWGLSLADTAWGSFACGNAAALQVTLRGLLLAKGWGRVQHAPLAGSGMPGGVGHGEGLEHASIK
jgi:uncharacterized membrane protein